MAENRINRPQRALNFKLTHYRTVGSLDIFVRHGNHCFRAIPTKRGMASDGSLLHGGLALPDTTYAAGGGDPSPARRYVVLRTAGMSAKRLLRAARTGIRGNEARPQITDEPRLEHEHADCSCLLTANQFAKHAPSSI